MPGIGADIKEVIVEMGITATVLRGTGNFTEKITLEADAESSNPFLREYHSKGSLSYDSRIVQGDLVSVRGTVHLVVNKSADTFEGDVVEYLTGLYRCNFPAGASIVYPSSVTNEDYSITKDWVPRAAVAHGLLYKDSRTAPLNSEASTGREPTFRLIAFVPASYNVQQNDRVVLSADEYYRVQDVETHDLVNVHALILVEDTRTP